MSPNPGGEVLVHVFRTVADPFVGQIAMLKVLSGVLRPSDRLYNATTGAEERMPALFRLRGAEHLPVDAFRTGEVGAVAKLSGSRPASLLWSRPQGIARPAPASRAASGVCGEPDAGIAIRRCEAVHRPRASRRRGSDARDRSHRRQHDPPRAGRHARRRRDRAHGAGPRRPRDVGPRPGGLSRDDREAHPGRGEAQEAVGRPRPVRRRAASRRAATRRHRLRVRRRRGRRRCASHLHPRRREGRARCAGLRRAAGPPGRRRAGGAVRRQVALRRLVGDGLPDGRIPRGQGGSGRGGHRAARTRLGR